MKWRLNTKKSNDAHGNTHGKKRTRTCELPKYKGCYRFALLLLPVTELGNGTESNVVVAGRMSSCDVTVPVVAFQVVTRVATKSLRDLWFLQLKCGVWRVVFLCFAVKGLSPRIFLLMLLIYHSSPFFLSAVFPHSSGKCPYERRLEFCPYPSLWSLLQFLSISKNFIVGKK